MEQELLHGHRDVEEEVSLPSMKKDLALPPRSAAGAGGYEGEDEEEEETRDASDSGGVVYEDPGAISVLVDLDEIREYFAKIKSRHKDPVGQPQE